MARAWKPAVGGGCMSIVAYGMVIWAMSIAPLAYVSALRETSVLLAAAIGTLLMGEPFGRRRILAAGLVVAGVAILQLSRT
jgi:drug/metabolite transporter (DMT)-like permease